LKESHAKKTQSKDIQFETRANPNANIELPSAKTDRFKLSLEVKAHSMAISGYFTILIHRIKMHPKKKVIATVSDDKSWKMWSFPSGELILSGEGHKDWIADCDFHPKYFINLMVEGTN
jgi:WD40 repeat protein